MLDVDFGLASHKLKGPLVSIKSLAFILKKEINKKDKKSLRNIVEIESKTEILNKRINQFILFLEYERGKVDLLYELFDLSEIIKKLKKKKKNLKARIAKQIIVADKEKIEFSLNVFLRSFSKIGRIVIVKKSRKIEFKINGQTNIEPLNTKTIFDEKNDNALDLFISVKIIELHGGSVKIDRNLIMVVLPLKPASKKLIV